ncbi:MAG: PAS domain S-box protein [Candidatus Eremiobacteraeota bacterium]|nr:PAS domain S-box protein [Candidatus Eremiobacteraeota bacterium]MBV8356078.1 PAS domain S-box protein [Candidatus Eremiobacteraeota bacterium]
MKPPSTAGSLFEAETIREVLESAPDAIVIVDERGRIVLSNAQTEKLFGYRRDELIGQTVDALVPSHFRGTHAGHRDRYSHDPRVRPMGAGLQLSGLRKDGTEFPVEISLSPVRAGDETFVASAIRDVTERKRFEVELQKKNVALENANLAKDRFLAGMSHELRTPLNAIIGFTGTLLMKLPGPLTAEQEKQLKTIQASARHLLSLINDILDLARIESGKVELSIEPLLVREVIDDVTTSLRPSAERKGLSLESSVPAQKILVRADRRTLQQILINLINNAIKYTEAGKVTIAMTRRRENGQTWVDIAVSDSGIGIKAEDQAKLFQAFEQLDPSSTRRFEGAGLGLYLSQQLAALLSGRLKVESDHGKGSTFTLTLPAETGR